MPLNNTKHTCKTTREKNHFAAQEKNQKRRTTDIKKEYLTQKLL